MITIYGTPQQIFNKVSKHLYEQGRPCSVGSTCKYRDGLGNMCAFGCLIPDDKYSDELEYKNVIKLIENGLLKFSTTEVESLCVLLQNVHDSYLIKNTTWKEHLDKMLPCVATLYCLEFNMEL